MLNFTVTKGPERKEITLTIPKEHEAAVMALLARLQDGGEIRTPPKLSAEPAHCLTPPKSKPVSSLAEFLHPRRSLCIVKAPYDGKIPEILRVEGADRNGNPVMLYAGESPENDQGYVKCQLDKYLHSPFLFISWKKRGCHIFRLIENGGVKAEFPALEPALAAYLPDGFTPEKYCLSAN